MATDSRGPAGLAPKGKVACSACAAGRSPQGSHQLILGKGFTGSTGTGRGRGQTPQRHGEGSLAISLRVREGWGIVGLTGQSKGVGTIIWIWGMRENNITNSSFNMELTQN